MGKGLFLLFFVLSGALYAQVGADAGGVPVRQESPGWNDTTSRWLRLFTDDLPTDVYAEKLPPPWQRPDFDYSIARPYLAFFCRLEINEARGGAIPLKFRLGQNRAWQDELLR